MNLARGTKFYLLLFAALVINLERGGATTITSADHTALPVGETITLTGTGFTGTTRASFIWRPFNTSAPFRELSDTSIEVDYAARQSIRVHSLLVEAAAGSTITSGLSESEVDEFEGSGTFTPTRSLIIVKAGAVLEGISNSFIPELIYVEAGGALSVRPDMFGGDLKIFAEDGSIVDFRSAGALPPHNASPVAFYSPNTEILGTVPEGFARQLTPISLSLGVGPFTQGYALEVISSEGGSVSRDSPGPYFARGATVVLTAEPEAGQFFTGWSGGATSTEEVISVQIPSAPITATFSSGRILTTYSGLGGQIIRHPDKPAYADGETVMLTAQPNAGFEFVRWANAISSEDPSIEFSITEDTEIIGIFRSLGPDTRPVITSVDHTALPVGETITLTGTGLSGTTRASFIWRPFNTSAPFRELSDTSIEVDYAARQSIRVHSLLVEAAAGSTITSGLSESEVDEFEGSGTFTPTRSLVIVKAGAILEGISNSFVPELIYVEAGGVLKIRPDMFGGDLKIFAEDGSIIDFRSAGALPPHNASPVVFYSPNTEILGTAPDGFARQLTPISLSLGVGPFTQGYALEVISSEGGSVSRDTPGPYYARGATVVLTAEPEAGQFFTGWSGGATSTEEVISVQIPSAPITATFSSGRILTTYSGLGGQVLRQPDKPVYSDGETVMLTAQPNAGFEFVRWANAISSEETSIEFSITEDTEIIGIFRSLAPDTRPAITSADHTALPVGETITLTGTGFTGTTRASFIWRPFNTSAPFRELSDTSLEVDYAARQSIRVHSLLVEAAAGSTITSDLSESEVDEFEGSGTFTPTRSLVIVKAGAILEGISNALVPELIYVEAGGVLKIRPDMFGGDLKIFAEDGSIIDFRSAGALPPHNASPVVFYSPHTEILGTAPDGFAQQLTPISLSLGVGPFTQGFRVSISTEGPGTISGFDESTTYYRRGEEINVEATPTPGNYFIRWTGSISSTANQLSLSANRNLNLVARFSPLADFISTWRAANFTPEQLADISISGLNADPDNDGNSNTTEYIFGGNPLIADTGAKVEVLNIDPIEKTIELSYNRPMFVADVNYIYLGSTDLTTWANLSETGQVDESSSEELSELREKVHLKVFFSDHFPENFSFRVSAALE